MPDTTLTAAGREQAADILRQLDNLTFRAAELRSTLDRVELEGTISGERLTGLPMFVRVARQPYAQLAGQIAEGAIDAARRELANLIAVLDV